MEKKKIPHNKKSNIGFIFELLSQQVISKGITNDVAKAKKAIYLIRKYFKKGTMLYEELKLINTIMYNQTEKLHTASRLLSEVLKEAKQLDTQKLKDEKYHLLNEIYANFNRDEFFKTYISNYKIYSSIFSLMENFRNHMKLDISEKVLLEEFVLNHLIDNKEIKRINEFKEFILSSNDTPDIDDVTMHFIVKKFNERYSSTLNDIQKSILREYIRCTSEKTFDKYAKKVTKDIELQLYENMKNIKDKSLLEKIYEAMKKLVGVDELSKDKKTEMLMTYANLVEELKKYNKGDSKK